ncbi:MAG TPA: PorV/PorQ family protein, partial [Flavisolibacter sp.]|nr:PorV/PorQ family protein [Flavisolibacter sp.]
MKSTALRFAAVTLLMAGGLRSVQGQTARPINVVTTAVPFLRISPDARAGGMGDLGIATTPDASSSYFNLGKVPFNELKTGLNLTYTPWLKRLVNDVYLASLAAYNKLDDNSAISASLRYFSLGQIQFTDNLGNPLQSFNPREFGIDVGYSRKLGENTGFGVGLKYIYSNLAGGSVGGNT